MSKLIVIFDTVVFVRALINPHSFWGRLVFSHSQEYQLVVSPAILREVIEVLQRPELTKRLTALQGIAVTKVLAILQHATVVTPAQEPQISRDTKDNKFLAAAEAAHADYLVSEDRDLLDLVAHHGTKIIPAREFLDILKAREDAV